MPSRAKIAASVEPKLEKIYRISGVWLLIKTIMLLPGQMVIWIGWITMNIHVLQAAAIVYLIWTGGMFNAVSFGINAAVVYMKSLQSLKKYPSAQIVVKKVCNINSFDDNIFRFKCLQFHSFHA